MIKDKSKRQYQFFTTTPPIGFPTGAGTAGSAGRSFLPRHGRAYPGHPPSPIEAQMAGTAPGHDGEGEDPAPPNFLPDSYGDKPGHGDREKILRRQIPYPDACEARIRTFPRNRSNSEAIATVRCDETIPSLRRRIALWIAGSRSVGPMGVGGYVTALSTRRPSGNRPAHPDRHPAESALKRLRAG